MRRLITTAALLALVGATTPAFARATIIIVNNDGPGEGFNDPTPRAPVGGNPGTTLGVQRLFAFQYAASLWGQALDSSVTIRIQATFDPLTCTATSAVLGSAGPIYVFRDFPNAQVANHWYHVALANKQAGFDLIPPDGSAGNGDDIRARFNSSIDSGCFSGTKWYYGFDANHGADEDLVTVLLHEFGHGLGFSTLVDRTSGALFAGSSDLYALNLFDDTLGKGWDAMTDAERSFSSKNGRNVVWSGGNVTASVPAFLVPGTPSLNISAPSSLAGEYAVGTAAYGPQPTAGGVSGQVAAAVPNTACTPLANAADVAGRIVLVDRGTCTFVVKTANVQAAGGIAVLVADNVADSPPAGLGGAGTFTIPSVRITQATGAAIRGALAGGVTARLYLNLAQRAGADVAGRAMVYATNPIIAGSTISHWDTSAFHNLLMEPAINADLTHDLDLTLPQMRDIGWYVDRDLDLVPDDRDACLATDTSIAEVGIDGCDTGVGNVLFTNGCTIQDLVGNCAAGAKNHGAFVSCIAHLGNDLRGGGVIDDAGRSGLQVCAAHAK